ncbi:MAG: ACT domain-containing protein [Paracoccaceae bacterium]
MSEVVKSAQGMIAGMSPVVRDGVFVFTSLQDETKAAALAAHALASYREAEGISLILPIAVAERAAVPVDQLMRCITLNVYSALDGVGLTAAVATALAAANIPCNMVAAYHHDHVFVPADLCDRAVGVLHDLQAQAAQQG